MNDGGPAFPSVTKAIRDNVPDPRATGLGSTVEVRAIESYPGMSLRDWFAGHALAGLATRPLSEGEYSKKYVKEAGGNDLAYAKQSYALADAMLAAREKGGAE